MVPLSSEEEVQHYKYQVSLSYPGFVGRHHITLTGYYDLDQEQKVTAFSLNLEGLPREVSPIEDSDNLYQRFLNGEALLERASVDNQKDCE